MFHGANILVFIGLKKLFLKKVIPKGQKASKSAFNAKKKADLAETVSTLVRQSEEEEAEVGVAAFLCQFFLQAGKKHAGRMPEICDCMQIRISKTMLTMLTLLILKLSVEEKYFYSQVSQIC